MNTSANAAVLRESTPAADASPPWSPALAAIDRRAAASRRRIVIASGLLLLLLATAPLWAGSSFGLARYSVAIAYVIAAIGLNLAFGFAGEMVLGHPAIMATAAYTAGMLSSLAGFEFWAAAPLGVLAGVAIGMLMMTPGLRVSGWYLALITMFMVIVLPHVVILGEEWTGGEFGLSGIHGPTFFGESMSDTGLFLLTLLAFVLLLVASANIVRSDWGYRLRVLRDARQAAQAVGIDLVRTRLATYLMCSVPPAVAGVLLAYTEKFVNAESFGISLTLLLLTGVVLGGAGTLLGPVIGMIPLIILSFWVGPFSPYNAIFLGLGLLAGTLLFPDGLVPALARRRRHEPDAQAVAGTVAGAGAAPGAVAESAAIGVAPDARVIAGAAPAGAGAATLVAEGISKRFGGLQALDGVSISLRPGAFVGLVGPNGSGKSTFLNAVSGVYPIDAGVVRVLGRDVTGEPVHRLARAGVGRTFQVPQLIDDLTALENIEIGLVSQDPASLLKAALRWPGLARKERQRRKRAYEVFVALGLPAEALSLPAAELPLGLKRIVEVGRAVVSEPSILLLDEPAAGLNDAERARLGQLLAGLGASGMTVLVVEHNVPFVMQFCEELVLLEAGKVTCTASLREGELPERLRAYLDYAPEDAAS